MSKTTFKELGLSNWIERRCNQIGIKQPTPIQISCIPAILNGESCIGAAKTGGGKTLAFALPIMQKLSEDPFGIFALILTPTRELAFQIADQFNIIGKENLNLRVCVIVGGMCMVEQGRQLSLKPHIVIATPGRLADHLDSCKTFDFDNIRFVVMDEADRLLSGGFDEQLERITQELPKDRSKRQTLFFSATITDTLCTVKQLYGDSVKIYESKDDTVTVSELEQHYITCPREARDSYLVQTVRVYRETDEKGSIVIFTSTCKSCQVLHAMLNELGFENVALHGMIPQKQRLAALASFKSNVIKILIATDVASRGLDIPYVQLVLNHTVPTQVKDYVHRVGRTARAGRRGKAVTLVSSPGDAKMILQIEEFINTQMTEFKINDKEVSKIILQVIVSRRQAEMNLEATDFFEKKLINMKKKWILEGKDPDVEEKKYRNKYLNKVSKKDKTIKKKKKKSAISNDMIAEAIKDC